MEASSASDLKKLLPEKTRILWYGKGLNPMLGFIPESAVLLAPTLPDAAMLARIRTAAKWPRPRCLAAESTSPCHVSFDNGVADVFLGSVTKIEALSVLELAMAMSTVSIVVLAVNGNYSDPADWKDPMGWVTMRREVSWSTWTALEAHSQLWLGVRGENAARTRIIEDFDNIFQKVFADVKPATAIVRGVDCYVVQRGKRQRTTYNLPAPCTAEKVFRSPAGSATDPTEFSPHEFLPLLGYGDQTNTHLLTPAWQMKVLSHSVPFKVGELMYRFAMRLALASLSK